MDDFLAMLFLALINLISALYFILMIAFLVSKNPKHKTIGKVMLGILIAIITFILFITFIGIIMFFDAIR